MTDISIALSRDGTFYIWGLCGNENIYTPRQTSFSSSNEILLNYYRLTSKPIYMQQFFDGRLQKIDGKYLKEYDDFGLVGRGSYGMVRKARNKIEDEICAVKQILLDNSGVELLLRELKIVFNIRSNHVVRYRSAWIENCSGTNKTLLLHIQMELCSTTLKEVIKCLQEYFNEKDHETLNMVGFFVASELFKEILESVNFLHRQVPPVIHRDLKPNNILITTFLNDKFVKLCDFGLATVHESEEQSHSEAKGTLKYMAPEVLTGKYDTKADIYSLGKIIPELFYFDSEK
jgi:serine/threonine protein kinase